MEHWTAAYVPVIVAPVVVDAVTANGQVPGTLGASVAEMPPDDDTLPVRVPELLLLGLRYVVCHVPVNDDPLCVSAKLTLPAPTVESCMLPE